MQPKVKFGLIVGFIGMLANLCVSFLFGLCGPLLAIIVGICAGLFAAQAENAPTKGAGAKVGATAGAIAGALVLVAQFIAGIGALILFQTMGVSVLGTSPSSLSGSNQTMFWLSGLGTGCCFGVVDLALSAGAGALMGYVITRGAPTMTMPAQPS